MNSRKKFFTGLTFLLIGQIFIMLGIERMYYYIPVISDVTMFTIPFIKETGVVLQIVGLACLFPFSKYFKTAFYLAIASAVLQVAYIATGMAGGDTIFHRLFYTAEFAAYIFAVYYSIDGFASYFHRNGNYKMYDFSGTVRSVFSTCILIACILSWAERIPQVVENNTLMVIVVVSGAAFELIGQGFYLAFLILSEKRD